MKKSNDTIKFSSGPVMAICFMMGLILIMLRVVYIDERIGIQFVFISELISVISGMLISISALNFFLSISTEKDLIDKIQTRINQVFDYSRLSKEEISNICLKLGQELALRDSKSLLSDKEANVNSRIAELTSDYISNLLEKTYYETYDRKITLYLEDEYIRVVTKTKLVYENIHKNAGLRFVIQPMFLVKQRRIVLH